MAVGVRTAPDTTGAVTSVNTTLHLIDASGDLTTDNILSVAAPSGALVQAWATKYQAASQASLYQVTQQLVWAGDADPDNAGSDQRNSVKDGINMLFKNLSTLRNQNSRLVAPLLATLQGNQDIPLLSSTEMADLIVAELAILTGFSFTSAQFTERRERKNNPRIK